MNVLSSLTTLGRVGITNPTHSLAGAAASELVDNSSEASRALRVLYVSRPREIGQHGAGLRTWQATGRDIRGRTCTFLAAVR